MGNPHKGEVEFKAGEGSYKLSFSADALASLEEALDMNVQEISTLMQDPKRFRVALVRTMFFYGLCDHHDLPDDMMTMDKARGIFKKLLVNEVIDLIGRAFKAAFPDQPETSGAADPPKPAEAAAGTGQVSSSNGSPAV